MMDSSAPYSGAEVFEMEKAQQAPTSGAEPAASEQEVPGGQFDENTNEDESRKQDDPNGNVLSCDLFLKKIDISSFILSDCGHQRIEIYEMKSC